MCSFRHREHRHAFVLGVISQQREGCVIVRDNTELPVGIQLPENRGDRGPQPFLFGILDDDRDADSRLVRQLPIDNDPAPIG